MYDEYEDDNDGRFPAGRPRERWPWFPGSIVSQCGPDEWLVCVGVRELCFTRDGRRAPRWTASRNLYYPLCNRDASEIRHRPASPGACQGGRSL